MRDNTAGNRPKARLGGVIPILPTPFAPSGEIDDEGFAQAIEVAISIGVHGVAMFGMASEHYKLSDAEKAHLTRVLAPSSQALPSCDFHYEPRYKIGGGRGSQGSRTRGRCPHDPSSILFGAAVRFDYPSYSGHCHGGACSHHCAIRAH